MHDQSGATIVNVVFLLIWYGIDIVVLNVVRTTDAFPYVYN